MTVKCCAINTVFLELTLSSVFILLVLFHNLAKFNSKSIMSGQIMFSYIYKHLILYSFEVRNQPNYDKSDNVRVKCTHI